jgi:hypothetical protein
MKFLILYKNKTYWIEGPTSDFEAKRQLADRFGKFSPVGKIIERVK